MKKQVWVFQYRRAYDEDYVEIFDKKPSRKFLDKMLMELLPDTFTENETTLHIKQGTQVILFTTRNYTPVK